MQGFFYAMTIIINDDDTVVKEKGSNQKIYIA